MELDLTPKSKAVKAIVYPLLIILWVLTGCNC